MLYLMEQHMLTRYLTTPLPLTSGIELLSLYLTNLIENMKEIASELIEGSLARLALPKTAVIILQIICFIGITSPHYS